MSKTLRHIAIEILKNTGEGVIAADGEQKVIFLNPVAESLTGWKEREAIDKDLSEIFHVVNEQISHDDYNEDLSEEEQFLTTQNILISREGKRIPLYENISPLRDEKGNFTGLVIVFSDISKQKHYEKLLKLKESRLETLFRLSHMSSSSIQDIIYFALEEAVRLTESTMGFLGFMNEDETLLTIHSWSKKTLQECTVKDRPSVFSVETLGLWGESLRQRKAFILNDYSAEYPGKKGCPEGHVMILRHMNIPVFDGEKIVAVAGVGNKEEYYNMSDVRQLTLLMDGLWKIIKEKKMEEALKRSSEEMEQRVYERTEQLSKAYEELQNEIFRRSLMERDLRESEEKFKTIGNTAQDGIVMIDNSGNITFWNRAAEKIFGYSEEEVTGKNFHRLLAPERFHESHFRAFEEFRVTGKGGAVGKTLELMALRKNGEEFPVELSLSSVNLKGLWHATGILRDITQRKKIDEALKESEKFLRSTIDSLSAHIAIVDEHGEIITVNRAWEDFAAQNNAETNVCEGASYLQVCDEAEGEFSEEAKIFASGMRSVMKGEKDVFSLEYSCDSPGEERWFTGRVTKFSHGGSVKTVISHENITDRKRVEKELLKSHRELEETYRELKSAQSAILQREKMASIGQLAAGVAHEINNPIGFVSGNLRALNKYINKFIEFMDFQSEIIENFNVTDVSDEVRSKRKKLKIDYIREDLQNLIKESLEGTERVSKIVQNLKTFSRVDEASYKEADINECIESTVNIVWNELKYKADVKKEYGPLPKVKCYPQELNQVFMNLLVNASQAIENFGEIVIKTWHDEGNIYISVSDTGCGMDHEVKNRIFEPFFTTKDVGKGTGLGLSITYDIIKKHNGEISVESEAGKGSTFTVKIPVTEE